MHCLQGDSQTMRQGSANGIKKATLGQVCPPQAQAGKGRQGKDRPRTARASAKEGPREAQKRSVYKGIRKQMRHGSTAGFLEPS